MNSKMLSGNTGDTLIAILSVLFAGFSLGVRVGGMMTEKEFQEKAISHNVAYRMQDGEFVWKQERTDDDND